MALHNAIQSHFILYPSHLIHMPMLVCTVADHKQDSFYHTYYSPTYVVNQYVETEKVWIMQAIK